MCSTRPPARSPRSRLRQQCRRRVPQRAPDRSCTQSSRFLSGAVCFLASAGCERGVRAWRAVSAGRGDNELAREMKLLQRRGCPGEGSAGPGGRVCCSSCPLEFLPPYLLFLMTFYFPFGFKLLCRVVWKREGRGGILNLLW